MPDRRTLGTPLDAVSAPGRTMIGMVAGLISERWPEIDQNRGRLHLGIPGRMKSESADLVRTKFVIDAGESQRWARLVAAACPRLAAALLTSSENVQTALDRTLGRTQSGLEAQMASLLWRLGEDPEYSAAARLEAALL
jgi:hypothetical protein